MRTYTSTFFEIIYLLELHKSKRLTSLKSQLSYSVNGIMCTLYSITEEYTISEMFLSTRHGHNFLLNLHGYFTVQVDEHTDRDHLIQKKLAMREKRQLHDILWSFYSWSGC